MEQAQGGRKIIESRLIAEFTLEGAGACRLLLMRYENREDGLFKIVLHDGGGNYFTADFPAELYEFGAGWRADLDDEPGGWALLFAGRAADGPFLAATWTAPEGEMIMPFLARNGTLEEVPLPEDF